MPRNGSGQFLPPQNSWNPAINGQQALPNDWMAILDDVTTALTQSLSADGQTPITGVLNFQGNRISNVGAPTGSGDALRWEQMTKGLDIASATTITIPVEGMLFDVTGTTTIITINDRFPGRIAFLRFDDVVELAHSTSLVLPSGVNAKTSAGDVLCVMNTESGVWQVVSWPRFAAANYPSDAEPTITWPYMTWADTGNMLLKRRNEANTDWVVIGPLLEQMANANLSNLVNVATARNNLGLGSTVVSTSLAVSGNYATTTASPYASYLSDPFDFNPKYTDGSTIYYAIVRQYLYSSGTGSDSRARTLLHCYSGTEYIPLSVSGNFFGIGANPGQANITSFGAGTSIVALSHTQLYGEGTLRIRAMGNNESSGRTLDARYASCLFLEVLV